MLRVAAFGVGCFSYAASFTLLLVDLPLRGLHSIIVFCSDRFLHDGDKLTAWGANS